MMLTDNLGTTAAYALRPSWCHRGFDSHRTQRKRHFDRSNRPASAIFLALVGFSYKGLLVYLTTVCWVL